MGTCGEINEKVFVFIILLRVLSISSMDVYVGQMNNTDRFVTETHMHERKLSSNMHIGGKH